MSPTKVESIDLRGVRHPVVYEVNARVLLGELPRTGKGGATLGTIPDALLDSWQASGIHAVWMMGVWKSGPLGITIAREFPGLQDAYRGTLPDFVPEDVGGSPYAVQEYRVAEWMGGDEGLATLRSRLAQRGIGLILDFIPNHTARDHAWFTSHPEYYVGSDPIEFGRDPGYPGWTDTAQLNPNHPGAREALIRILEEIAKVSDGVRCDMAMLVLQPVFARTWGEKGVPADAPAAPGEFWADAIARARKVNPAFLFVAETYWNMEWDLQQLGFDFTYDKTMYDRLLREGAGAVRDHLRAEMEYQRHSLRFIENHDEPRAAHALSSEPWHYAAATAIATVPGMVMFHEGEFEGRRVKVPVQLLRRPAEKPEAHTRAFYDRLLSVIAAPVFQKGEWRLLMPRGAWHENYTWQNFLLFWWFEKSAGTRLVVINYAPQSGQCYADLPLEQIPGTPIEFRDLMGQSVYSRDRGTLASKGIYFDLSPYGIHIFDVSSGRR